MTAVFVDTSYFVAILNDSDQWHDLAVAARGRLPDDVSLVTTDEVLVEVLASFSKTGEARKELSRGTGSAGLELEHNEGCSSISRVFHEWSGTLRAAPR